MRLEQRLCQHSGAGRGPARVRAHPRPASKLGVEQDQRPGWLAGTALLIKREIYDQLHGLDDHIFMYGEDVEFCLRAKAEGIEVDYFQAPKLIHLGQASGSSRAAILGEYKGLKYIYQKHQPAWQYFCLRLLLKVGALLRLIIFRNPIYAEAFKLA